MFDERCSSDVTARRYMTSNSASMPLRMARTYESRVMRTAVCFSFGSFRLVAYAMSSEATLSAMPCSALYRFSAPLIAGPSIPSLLGSEKSWNPAST